MSTQYFCSLYFNNSKSKFHELLKESLSALGFTPTVMTIYINWDNMLEEVSYDESYLLSISSEKLLSIEVRNKIYDEGTKNFWFRIKMDGDFTSLVWSNENLDFLISRKIFDFLKMNGFMAGYVYENEDAFNQTNDAKTNSLPGVANYPGQSKYVCGMQFMAAPLMWFGEGFFEIISKDKLLRFNKAEELPTDIVEVRLFNIYESPKEINNRKSQIDFWSFFDLDKAVIKFEENKSIDAVQSLNNFLANMKPQKKSRK